MAYLTDRKRAEGLGSAKSGTKHFWKMIGSSIALQVMIPLFVFTFGMGLGGTFEEVQAYFSKPLPVIIMAASLIVLISHFTAEAAEAVEDYMHGMAEKLTLLGLNALAYTLIAVGLFALARMAL
ncbi:succinate dehydrogenase, hydrophobic membrane anchor protein [Pseudooctadecabacter jejudonensis]|uniref:Succinate dehydrogenase/Fumarate reductase transmembrane subunit n=1 Tax=Pseudooctadecabacter jejudonensis TaxID=1391910 RepID=A0A1Y5RVD4_9RHOB|nr:succinate dehydrogenase [Pseudooctadecabacter jejudonensis]SLN26410.1 Succinate dehydrogenase/Fumarate reductase transmembrane subunit [Pseudooctadecabacter jejudonensis]